MKHPAYTPCCNPLYRGWSIANEIDHSFFYSYSFTMFRTIARTQLQSARGFSGSAIRSLAVGDKIPNVPLYEGSPGNEVQLAEELAKKKALIVGVPGAFSPACSASHVPGYVQQLGQLSSKGIDEVFVVAVNDPFVTKAWGNSIVGDKASPVKFLSDPRGEFSGAWDVLFDAAKVFGNKRSARYAALVENGQVTKTFVEPDNISINVSAADKVVPEL